MVRMSNGTSFDSTKESLDEILRDINSGKIQLPDFQRGWVWDDNHVISLLASISVSFPIGAVMLYETGNPDVLFKPRPIEGVPVENGTIPEWLILDGQQRLTSLFQALKYSQVVATRDSRGKKIKRWYYIHIPSALDDFTDQEDAIKSIPEDKKIRNFRGEVIGDYSTLDLECQSDMFPLNLVFDTSSLTNWQMRYLQVDPDKTQERLVTWNRLIQEVIQRFQKYQVPLIKMFKSTPKEAVCQVFEKVNTGGVSLTVFELLTATFAVDNYNLREDWAIRSKRLKEYAVLNSVQSDDLLQAISLLASWKRRRSFIEAGYEGERAPAITCKRRDLLRLTLEEYKEWADKVTHGFIKAARFIHSQRIFDARDLPYRTQLVPLAAIFTHLGNNADQNGVRSKLAKWYWCGVFGELYGGAIETRFGKDLPEVVEWTQSEQEPTTVSDANFTSSRLYTLKTRNSAAYKGIYALLIKDGCYDFMTGEEITIQHYFDENIDIHHIFPRIICKDKDIDNNKCDCIINKTALSARTNRIIGGNAPSVYLARIKKSAGIDDQRMVDILASHVIEPEALYTDDFETFFNNREQELIDRIEKAMGKKVQRELIGEPEEYEIEDRFIESFTDQPEGK